MDPTSKPSIFVSHVVDQDESNYGPGDSFMLASVDVSRLDFRHRQELQSILEDKDKLILERTSEHRHLLDENSLLKEGISARETELNRTKKAMSDQVAEIKDYKEKLKSQHEELLGRLRMAEEVLKDVSVYASAMTKLVVLVYSKSLEVFTHPEVSNIQAVTKEFDTVLKEIDRCFLPIEEKRGKKPKRIIGSLEELKNSYKFIQDRIKVSKWVSSYEEFCKERDNNSNKGRTSFRGGSFRGGSFTGMNQASSPINVETLKINQDLNLSLSSEGSKLFFDLSKLITDISKSQIQDTSNLDKLFSHSLLACIEGSKDYLEKNCQGSNVAEKFKINRQSSLVELQAEKDSLLQAAADEEMTDLEEKIYATMKDNAALKDQLVNDRHMLQRQHANLTTLTEESGQLQTQLDDVDQSLREVSRMIEDETAKFDTLLADLNSKKLKLKTSQSELAAIKMQNTEMQGTVKEITKRVNSDKASLEFINQDRMIVKQSNGDMIANRESVHAIESLVSPVKDQPNNHQFDSPFTPLRDLAKTSNIAKSDINEDLMVQLDQVRSKLRDHQSAESVEGYAESVEEFRNLCLQIAEREVANVKCGWMTQLMADMNEQLKVVRDSANDLQEKAKLAEQSLSKKRSELTQSVADEAKSKEAYIKSELKLEIHQQKVLTLQDSIEKYRTMMADAERQADLKRRDELMLSEKLGKSKRRAIELQPIVNRRDDEALMEPLIPIDKIDHSMPTVNISYVRVCIACAIPVMIAYFLLAYKL